MDSYLPVLMEGEIILGDDTKDRNGSRNQELSEKHQSTPVAARDAAKESPINKIGKYVHRLIRNKSFLITSGLILFILFSVGTFALIYTKDHQRILEGVTISGKNVGNLTQSEAKSVLDQEVTTLLNRSVTFNMGQEAPEESLVDLGLNLNQDLALQEAYDIGRTGSLYDKVVAKMFAQNGVNLNFTQKWDDAKMGQTLTGTLDKFSDRATDATFKVTADNTMTIQKEHTGRIIDSEGLIIKIKEINIYKLVPELKVDFKEQLPVVTAVQLESQKITGLLATYTTQFNPSDIARSENVRLSANSLDMAIIKPGEILSFNKIVGERTVKGGYKDAYIIVNGEFVPGLAGGICQVSSTLYNTGLLANLSVTQRSNHDLAITYVPLGQDATVAYPDLDLKFNNNTGGYLLVRTKTTKNALTIELYGKVKPGQVVMIGNTIESIIPSTEQRLVDETMAHGASVLKQKGQPGYVVTSVRTVKVNGAIVNTEPLTKSKYLALPKVFAVGP